MTEVYDIIGDDGNRVITCQRRNGQITFIGKASTVSFEELMAQATNPQHARQRKSQLAKRRAVDRTRSINAVK